jgi:hypothetical protein
MLRGAMAVKRKPWNWCKFCQAEILQARGVTSKVQCNGCDRVYSVERTGKGTTHKLTPMRDRVKIEAGDCVVPKCERYYIVPKDKKKPRPKIGADELHDQYPLYFDANTDCGMKPGERMHVVQFVDGYGQRAALVQGPWRPEPIFVWVKYLKLDVRETEAKRKEIREQQAQDKRTKREALAATVAEEISPPEADDFAEDEACA